MVTGFPIKDKTQAIIWEDYINANYESILTMPRAQINAFLKHPTNSKNGMTYEAIKSVIDAQKL